MASAFAHAVVTIATVTGLCKNRLNYRLLILAIFCTIMPDLDVLAFKFSIPYASPWGHRGFTHSISFAVLVAMLAMFFSRSLRAKKSTVFFFIFFATISHALLDMLTNGGLGVALYWPYLNDRLFFPFRPIEVSPIGIARFFSENGLRVIQSELLWVGLPSVIWFFVLRGIRCQSCPCSLKNGD